MVSEDRIEFVRSAEQDFDTAVAAIAKLGKALDEFEGAQPAIARFAAYYGSSQWFDDLDADEAGAFPADLKRGILTEDLPFDALEDHHALALRMLEIATRALKEE